VLSIIIPSYKEAISLGQHLPGLLNHLNLTKILYEVIVVDDGSNDGGATESIVKEQGCIYLSLHKNRGKGAAVKRGMLHAKGDYKIFTDADIPFQYESIELFLSHLKCKEIDIVIGDRTLEGSSYFQEISGLRKWSSLVFTFFVGRFVTTRLMDTQCGIKGFKAAVANDLFSVSLVNGFAFDVEILFIALKRKYEIKRVPVSLRNANLTGFSLLRHAPAMIKDVFLLQLNQMRGRYTRL
jgi:dolichyl-phosphate beta-glucosyltransferase